MKVHPEEINKTKKDYQKECHESKSRIWCEKCQVWFDERSARRHQH